LVYLCTLDPFHEPSRVTLHFINRASLR